MLNPRTDITAWKTIFSFPRRPEKMVFQKKIALEYGLSCIIGKDFFFPENMILPLRRKMKDDLPEKNMYQYDIFFKCFEKMVF